MQFAIHGLCWEGMAHTSICFYNEDDNNLTVLPAEIGNLSNLKALYVCELTWKQKQTDNQCILNIIVVVAFEIHSMYWEG